MSGGRRSPDARHHIPPGIPTIHQPPFAVVRLKRGASARIRGVCYVAALLVFGLMLGIARTHEPLGPLRVACSLLAQAATTP